MSIGLCRHEYVSVESLGRSSVAGGGSLFPPGYRARLPCRARYLPRFSNAPAACPRPNALTLNPLRLAREKPGFLFGRRAACSPLSTLLIAAHLPRFPSRRGLRSLRSRLPRHATSRLSARRADDFPSVERRGRAYAAFTSDPNGRYAIGDGFYLLLVR